VNNSRFGGVWIQDLWADVMENECNCAGCFPILRVANEALGRGAQLKVQIVQPRKIDDIYTHLS